MKWNLAALPWKWIRYTFGIVLLVSVAFTFPHWWPPLSSWIDATLHRQRASEKHGEEGHADHDSAVEPGHAAATSLELTPQARSNLGLTSEFLRPIELSTERQA